MTTTDDQIDHEIERRDEIIRQQHDIIGYERALADDLADKLDFIVNGDGVGMTRSEIQASLARYRTARGPVRKPDRKMSNEEVDQAARYREARS